ncbi:PQQ-binding-like beta-propeller repeat protein [Streptomyces sp. NPDC055692]|uniref:outer membrane protein assembly factor BamB family protein n=1 Tax=Streptomyces sp. NPDC055692 TaxID=3155683 RepID=UPI003418ECFE
MAGEPIELSKQDDETGPVAVAVLALLGGALSGYLFTGLSAKIFDFAGDNEFNGWVFVPSFFGLPMIVLFNIGIGSVRPLLRLALALVGAVLASALFLFVSGDGVSYTWKAPRDWPRDVRALGSWTSGDIVVRVRPDAVEGYRFATGEFAWQWTPPGRESVCAMSAEVGDGTGLISHSVGGKSCDTMVALDLASGKARWTTDVHSAVQYDQHLPTPGKLAIAGQTAVVQEQGRWRGVNLADGKTTWHAAIKDGCKPVQVAGGPGSVVTVTSCTRDSSFVLRSLTPQDGRERMHANLPVTSNLEHVAVLSTDPPTLWVDEHYQRGTHAVLSYDPDGKVRSTIPTSAPEYDLHIELGDTLRTPFRARPGRAAVVVGDTLIATAVKPHDISYSHVSEKGGKSRTVRHGKGRLVAYSLADGSFRWMADLDDEVNGLAVDSDAVWALTRKRLVRVDIPTGRRTSTLTIRSDERTKAAYLWAADGRFVIVAEDGTDRYPPAVGLH